MKLSYSKAWDATGLTGFALRWAVYNKLYQRFLKENPGYDKYWGRATLGALGAIALFFVMKAFSNFAAPQLPHDITYSAALVPWAAYIAGIVGFICSIFALSVFTGGSVIMALKQPNPSRYIFHQHRDDEVEL